MAITLKAARVNAGYTQEAAAKKIGASTDTLRKWESGKAFPDILQLKKIESLYGVMYADLIFLTENSV